MSTVFHHGTRETTPASQPRQKPGSRCPNPSSAANTCPIRLNSQRGTGNAGAGGARPAVCRAAETTSTDSGAGAGVVASSSGNGCAIGGRRRGIAGRQQRPIGSRSAAASLSAAARDRPCAAANRRSAGVRHRQIGLLRRDALPASSAPCPRRRPSMPALLRPSTRTRRSRPPRRSAASIARCRRSTCPAARSRSSVAPWCVPGTIALTVSRPLAAYSKVTSIGQFFGSPSGRSRITVRPMAVHSPGSVLSPSSTCITIDRWFVRLGGEPLRDLGRQRRVARNQHDVRLPQRLRVDPFDAQAVRVDVGDRRSPAWRRSPVSLASR